MPRTAACLRKKASTVLAFLLCSTLVGCSSTARAPDAVLPAGWRAQPGPAHVRGAALAQAASVWMLARDARVAPLRYRVVVVPGSGCAGMGPVAARYFAGLLHAQVLVLHKPGVHPMNATPADACPPRFVQADALGAWQEAAQAAVQAWADALAPSDALPTVLVGISEGAELTPALAPLVPRLAGVVLIGSSGLDPREAGALQAQRRGYEADWAALQALQARPPAEGAPDTLVAQGRSLRYWRDLWQWPLAQPLLEAPWPLLQSWGTADALVPPEAYARFAARARDRAAPWCPLPVQGADHGLQTADHDGVQRVWAMLEQWARAPQAGWCAAVH